MSLSPVSVGTEEPKHKMDPEKKAAWTQALRSGEFTQGYGALYDSTRGGYCCLGVLCELAAKAGVVEKVNANGAVFYKGTGIDQENCHLPKAVQEWAGLDTPSPIAYHEGMDRPLAGINDAGRANFTIIADLIEGQL